MPEGAAQATKRAPGAVPRRAPAPAPAEAARHVSEPGAAAERSAGARSPRATAAPPASSLVREALATPGSDLDATAQAWMEDRLGHDFSAVRIHTGAKADDSAHAVGARAYTVGEHIVFSNGYYQPGTAAGRMMLAHELTHVIQQRRASVDGTAVGGGLRVSDPADRFEREADRVARQVAEPSGEAGLGRAAAGTAASTAAMAAPSSSVRPSPVPALSVQRDCGCGSTGACTCSDHDHDHDQHTELPVQRFGSQEHVRLGDDAVPGQSVLITSFGRITYGEMIALGDFFSSVAEIEQVAELPNGKEQIAYALWKVNPAGRPRPAVVEQDVEDRYNQLAARNETHFSTGSSPGNSNREQYIARHREALRAAWFQGLNPLVVRRSDWQAQEAFADHFLTDAFSAGHVRTPRGSIQRHWEALYPDFRDNLVTTIACYMASYINARDAIGNLVTVDYLTGQIAQKIRTQGGSKLSSFSIGDLISKVLHDADNAGLDVVSQQGPTGTGPVRWRAVGDDHLFPGTPNAAATQTAQFAEEAVRRSFAEGRDAERAGLLGDPLTPLLDATTFRALPLLPSEDSASATNPAYAWNASSIATLPSNIQALIVNAFTPGQEVRNGLDGMDSQIPEITPSWDFAVHFDLHTGEAWRCFKGILLRDPMAMLVLIGAGRTCPPGKNSPCATTGQNAPAPPAPVPSAKAGEGS